MKLSVTCTSMVGKHACMTYVPQKHLVRLVKDFKKRFGSNKITLIGQLLAGAQMVRAQLGGHTSRKS